MCDLTVSWLVCGADWVTERSEVSPWTNTVWLHLVQKNLTVQLMHMLSCTIQTTPVHRTQYICAGLWLQCLKCYQIYNIRPVDKFTLTWDSRQHNQHKYCLYEAHNVQFLHALKHRLLLQLQPVLFVWSFLSYRIRIYSEEMFLNSQHCCSSVFCSLKRQIRVDFNFQRENPVLSSELVSKGFICALTFSSLPSDDFHNDYKKWDQNHSHNDGQPPPIWKDDETIWSILAAASCSVQNHLAKR